MMDHSGDRIHSREPRASERRGTRPTTWRAYLAITGTLLLVMVSLVGGIIWYNAKHFSTLTVAQAEQRMADTGKG